MESVVELQTAVILLPNELVERMSEAQLERTEDNPKLGFTNLSNGGDDHFDPFGRKINGRR